ncbi:MAG TPA: PPOX class F420-dependent oxidoreductase, partial [Blastocatellia bacterium]|nr:PPOX class F420-dependent oxidoreductase [Blastocatellia bacterium]
VDDLESISPPMPRGIKIHGSAEIVERQGQLGHAPYLKVTPERYWSWGIERPVFEDGQVVMKKQSREG